MLRLVLATIHLLALGIGLGAVWGRARALARLNGGAGDAEAIRRALAADAWWGMAALLWIGTGLWRVLAETEKATDYYLSNHAFLAKMGMLGAILLLELWPMVTLVKWRGAIGRVGRVSGVAVETAGRRIARLSYVQVVLVIAMVAAAAAMARGYGAR